MNLLSEHRDELFLALLALNAMLGMALLYVVLLLRRMNRRYTSLMRSLSGGDVEGALQAYTAKVEAFTERLDRHENVLSALDEAQKGCLQRIGVVRFDAFEDVGGQQSFALALLDARRNGVTLSSLYGRSDVRVYAKSIESGKPSHTLTQEEGRALAQADGK